MANNEIVITPEGTIRTPSLNPESMHEFKMDQGRVLYRWIHPDGTEHANGNSEWMFLTTRHIDQHFDEGPRQLQTWFEERGITKGWIDQSLATERQTEPRRGSARRFNQ